MRTTRLIAVLAGLTLALTLGCNQKPSNPSVKDSVAKSLEAAGFREVKVSEDQDKGVVTIKGSVGSQDDKYRAGDIARQSAGNSVVANELLVVGPSEDRAEDVAKATDESIEAAFKLVLEKANLTGQNIKSKASNGVLTLNGNVNTADQRAQVEQEGAMIKGVTQVVNKLEIKRAKS